MAKKTRATAGRKGGKSTLRKYGPDFYARIGSKGGRKTARTKGARR